jgi:hypothetical protein
VLKLQTRSEIFKVLEEYTHLIDVALFQYFLAVEDYEVFHDFMCEKNRRIYELSLKQIEK